MNRNRQRRQNHRKRKADKAAKEPNAQRKKVFRKAETPRRYGPIMPGGDASMALALGLMGGEMLGRRALADTEKPE